MCEVETWKEIPGFDGKYSLSSHGRIHNHRFDRDLITNRSTSRTWTQVCLRNGERSINYRLSYLVAEMFLPKPKDRSMRAVVHRDGNRSNNCVDNLAWHTRSFTTMYYKACAHDEVRETRRFRAANTGRVYNSIMDFASEHLFNPMDVYYGLRQDNRHFGAEGRLIYLDSLKL